MLKGRTTTKQEQDPKDTKRSNIGITIQKDKEIERKIEVDRDTRSKLGLKVKLRMAQE